MADNMPPAFGLRQLFSQAFVYGGSTLLCRLLTYLLFPFYTHVLVSSSSYGLLNELYAYAALFNILYLYGLETAYFRHATKPPWDGKQLLGQLTAFVLLSGTLFSASLLLFAPALSHHLGYGAAGSLWIRLLSLVFLLDALAALPLAHLRLQGRSYRFALLRLLNVLLNLFLNVLLLWAIPQAEKGVWGNGLTGVACMHFSPLTAILIANLCASLLWIPLLFGFWKELRWPKKELLVSMLRYGLPLAGMGAVGMAIEVLPRVSFRHFYAQDKAIEALEALGAYAATAKLALLMGMALQAYRYAADPLLLNSESGGYKTQLARTTRCFLLLASAACVALSLHALPLSEWLIRRAVYRSVLQALPILLFSYLFMGLYYHLSIWYKRLGKTHYGLFISLGGLFVSVLTLFLGIPSLGVYALALAFLAAYLSMTLTSYLWGQRLYPINYAFKKPLGIFCLGIPLILFLTPNTPTTYASLSAPWPTLITLAYLMLCAWGIYNEGLSRKHLKKLIPFK